MRILSITAGAAGMYCGSCFRDNALAAELIARGHDVSLVPMYTPVRTDEPSVSAGGRVLFGGISVYLQQQSAIFRKTPRLLDRLWDSPGVISAFANRAAATDASQLGDLTTSMLEGDRPSATSCARAMRASATWGLPPGRVRTTSSLGAHAASVLATSSETSKASTPMWGPIAATRSPGWPTMSRRRSTPLSITLATSPFHPA